MTPEQISELRRQKYNATVVRVVKAQTDLLTMRVRPDFPIPPHKPGQYTTLGLGFWEPRYSGCQDEGMWMGEPDKLARRAYSISCPILSEHGGLLDRQQIDWLEFYIVLVRDARKDRPPALTPRLFCLKPGDRLYLSEKIAGNYNLDPVKPSDTILFLSTGTGEAPHNYMLWDLLRRGHAGRILSVSCVRYWQDLGYRWVHECLMVRYPNYTYLPLTTREPENEGRKVYIQHLITSGELERVAGLPLEPETTHVFLCGNPSMIGVPEKDRTTGLRRYPKPPGVVEILEGRGFRADQPSKRFRGNIHYETYW
jgi:ferredoxin--NADP+ reductase